nr:hypothetical protein [Candidatus Microthrix sp.]
MHAEQAELAELGGHLLGSPALVPIGDVGEDLVADEAPHRVAQQHLVLVEQGVQRQHVARVHLMGQLLMAHGPQRTGDPEPGSASRQTRGDPERDDGAGPCWTGPVVASWIPPRSC